MTKPVKSLPRRGGPPPKAPGGLKEVLFVRTNGDLLEALDALVDLERERRQGRTVSRSDLARELLYRAVAEERRRLEDEPPPPTPSKEPT